MAYEVTIGGASVRAEVTLRDDGLYEVTLDGHTSIVDARFPEPGVLHMIRGGEAFEFDYSPTTDGHEVVLYGTRYVVDVLDERRKVLRTLGASEAGAAGQLLSTSMPGKVVALLVEVGDVVAEDQGIVVVEAMKMENELKATGPGVVVEIAVAEGDTVEGGATLVVIGPLEQL